MVEIISAFCYKNKNQIKGVILYEKEPMTKVTYEKLSIELEDLKTNERIKEVKSVADTHFFSLRSSRDRETTISISEGLPTKKGIFSS